MKKLKVKILVGIPASGKSTWGSTFVRTNSDWVRVNRDDFRLMLKDQQVCENKIEALINDFQDNAIVSALGRGLNVLIDNTNLKASYLEHFIQLVKHLATVEFQIFDIPLKTAIERNSGRIRPVPENAIKQMYGQYLVLLDSFDFSNRPQVRERYSPPAFNSDLDNVILCDIDGTLAHMTNRSPYDWDKVDRDDVDIIVADRLRAHAAAGEAVIIVTGRDASCRKLTEEWLEFYNIPYFDLLMRAEGDSRKDSIVKKEIWENHIKGKFNTWFVYDDRNQVVKTWRELGIKTFQVADGNF